MRHILVPTDFSDNARNALEYALQLSAKLHCPVTIYHACQVPTSSSYRPAPSVMEQEKKMVILETGNKLSKLCEEITAKGYKCSTKMTVSGIYEGIASIAGETGADLIVMGTTGASGLTKWLFGSTTADVIMNSTTPVLAVPEKAAYRKVEKIVFATDYKDSDFIFIGKLINLASYLDSEIGLLHIQTEEGEFRSEALFTSFKERVRSTFSSEKISFHLLEKENIVEAINRFSNEYGADIISMATSRKNLFDRIFNKSLTREMTFITEIPLLAFTS